jgi:hypothetical protein
MRGFSPGEWIENLFRGSLELFQCSFGPEQVELAFRPASSEPLESPGKRDAKNT